MAALIVSVDDIEEYDWSAQSVKLSEAAGTDFNARWPTARRRCVEHLRVPASTVANGVNTGLDVRQ
jgi:hypothetical protein